MKRITVLIMVVLAAGVGMSVHAAAPIGATIWLYSSNTVSYVTVDANESFRAAALGIAAVDLNEKFIIESAGGSNILLKAMANGNYLRVHTNDVNKLYASTTNATDAYAKFTWNDLTNGNVRLTSVGNSLNVSPSGVSQVLRANTSSTTSSVTEYAWGVVSAPPETGPRIAATQYSDFDVPLITIDASTEFGADKTGAADSTAAIQAALDAASANRGGIVYLPAGNYVLTNTITIPESVTLRGDWKRPTATNKTVAGTVLRIQHGEGLLGIASLLEQDTRHVGFFLGKQAVLRDLSIYYPNQSASSPKTYPYTIDSIASFPTVRNVTLVNPYEGIYYGKHDDDNSVALPAAISVYGSPLHTGLKSDKSTATPRYESVHFTPDYWAQSGLAGAPTRAQVIAAMRAGTVPNHPQTHEDSAGFRVGDGDGGGTYLGLELSGYDIGLMTFDEQSPRMFDFQITGCRIGIDMKYTKENGWVIIKGRVDAEETAVRLGSSSAHVSFNNVAFGSNGQLIDHMAGTVTFVNCTFERWGSGYAIDSYSVPGWIPSSLSVNGCDFQQDAQHICLHSNVSQAVIYGNTPMGSALKILNDAGGLPNIVIDTTNVHHFAVMDPVDSVEEMLKLQRHVPQPPAGASHVFNVKSAPYNAYGTAKTSDPDNAAYDDTAEFQAALNAAGSLATASAGCIVYVPPGVYRISGRLNVPSNVELRGVQGGGHSSDSRSILCLFSDRDQPANPATIQLAADSGIAGLAIARPEQTYNALIGDTTLHAYPAAIGGTDRNWAYNIVLINTYDGIDFSTGGGHEMDYVYGVTLHQLVKLSGDGALSTMYNFQCKSKAWRDMASSKSNYDLWLASGFGDEFPGNLSKAEGIDDTGTGLVLQGNGSFRMLSHFINRSGDGNCIINGSPTVNMYICGGEGDGTGITINSIDGAAMDIEFVGNSYHTTAVKNFTCSDTDAGDELHIFDCKEYGNVKTNHVFRGSGHFVVQQDFRGEPHTLSLMVSDTAQAIVESGFFYGMAMTAARALNNSQVEICGALMTGTTNWNFNSEDETRIFVQSVCPATLTGITGKGGAFAPPPAPTGLVATAGGGSVSLVWKAVSAGDLAGYNIYRATASGYYGGAALATGAVATNFNDSLVTNGTTYYYVVTAVDTNGSESAGSTEVSATPMAVVTSYAAWAATWGFSIGSETNDYDGDGLNNFEEYALDGNPTNAANVGTWPIFTETAGGFNYIYPKRSDDAKLVYTVETRTNLVSGSWTNAGYTVGGTNVTGGTLNYVSNLVNTVEDKKFIRLKMAYLP